MGRRSRAATRHAAGHTDGEPGSGSFPLIVALFSTVAALLLFFSTTVPAIAEARHLDRVESGNAHTNDELWQSLEADALHRIAIRVDVQSLMVELERRGVYTGDLFEPAANPERDPDDAENAKPGEAVPAPAGDR